jgi:DNA polymerase-3 subunit alpha
LGEVDVELDRQYPVNPQIRGALRSLNGVQEVIEI